MRQKKAATHNKSLRILVFFCVIVGLLIVFSLLVRSVYIVQNSQFSGDSRFTIAFISNDKDLDIVSYDPLENMLSHLAIHGTEDVERAKMEVGVFTDTTILLEGDFSLDKSISSYMIDSLFHKNARSSLSGYDLIRLAIATSGISKEELVSENITFPVDRVLIDKTTKELFYDTTLSQENMTIEIVNGTGVEGLGGRLERALTIMGGNVISVTNAEKRQQESSIVYYGEENYTVKRLVKLLGMSAKNQEGRGLSDIIIVIGQDKKDTLSY